MCEYCEFAVGCDDEEITPLPTPDSHPDSAQMGVFDQMLVAVMYPPVVAGPINFCPMCGCDLRSVE